VDRRRGGRRYHNPGHADPIGEVLHHALRGLLPACLSVASRRNVVRQRLGQLLAGAAIHIAEGENAAGDGRLNRRA